MRHEIGVAVYHLGATWPHVINPCRTMRSAQALKTRIEAQLKQRGWSMTVRIEDVRKPRL